MKRRKDRRGGRRNNSGRKKKRVTGADGRAVGLESGGSSSILGSRPVDEVDGDGGDDDNGTELDEGLDISAAIDLANEGENDVVEEFDQVREQEDNGEQALDREFDGTVIGDYHFEYEDEIDGKSVEYEGEIYGESAHIHSNNGIADDVDEPFGRISDNFVSLNNFDSDVDDDEELDDNDDTDSAEVEIPAVHTEYLRSVLADVKNEHSKIHKRFRDGHHWVYPSDPVKTTFLQSSAGMDISPNPFYLPRVFLFVPHLILPYIKIPCCRDLCDGHGVLTRGFSRSFRVRKWLLLFVEVI